MKAYVGVGSNLAEERCHLTQVLIEAVKELNAIARVLRVSPVYETPALLEDSSPESWNRPYKNLVVEVDVSVSVYDFFAGLKKIETRMGRVEAPRWAPRWIDLDLLLWGDERILSEDLQVPHKDLEKRSFVLDPLKDLLNSYVLPARKLEQHAPLWMGILNLTPDSFSEGWSRCDENFERIKQKLGEFEQAGVHIIDLGAESTRPGASRVAEKEEWERLKPYLEFVRERYCNIRLRPKISVDTYKPEIAERCIEAGIDVVNDVSGLESEKMLRLLKNSSVEYVLMHSLGVPVDPKNTVEGNVVEELVRWLERKLELLEKNGVSLGRIYFDPGLGFGKNSLQSLEIVKKIEVFHPYPVKLLVGHSRKSLMKAFSDKKPAERDIETLGVSMQLIQKRVDVLRVHNPELNIRAYRGWSHVANCSN